MRIAQVAPLYESVPPALYGGTERIVSHLTEELVRQGHSVWLFASADSRTSAHLVPVRNRAIRLDDACVDPLAPHVLMLEKVAAEQHRFDVIHYHVDYLHFPLSRRGTTPHVTTLHGRLDLPELQDVYAEFTEMPLISISDAQRRPLPRARWIGTVHHGVPPELYRYSPTGSGYLAFLGRISPEKRVDRAIEIAVRCGRPLRIAAKVDKADRDYFEASIKPLLGHPLVEYVGEIGDAEKSAFLGGADALLFPIDWPEPFGLVVIEALACGTPVVAFRGGAIPEVIDEGQTGFVVNDIGSAVAAVERAVALDRSRVRVGFERRFTARRMATDYVELYKQVVLNAAAAA